MEHPTHFVHTLRIPVRWGDMDALGHVNNTVYFRYTEQARIDWLESLGFAVLVGVDEGPVIINASCTFFKPITYPATVEVRTLIGKPGRSSLPTYYEIRCVGDDTLYAEGAAKIVWWNPGTGKSLPLPDYIREIYPHD
ncbi:MAG: acyl-CoA thioesterase [Gammaproteobacteria bacterium]|nr:acyl-CoA thioesterase [Rhodocyclaceae bacterium]MBU3909912.1 acyl-CoA thioesterase [Gammaproteobacteria bacterium]MBU3988936.1 acyl-CoA thioesterase [Gammaproteobacteria bacterium]MBU4003509.1 acyl-CoA thioesterase [Gammaproteobacteria bacterium]MBU4020132.1 acyl-CoA thioesterase [Gammaproteobacteria bacterium]